MAYYKREKQKENNKSKELTMDAVDIIHTGKHLIPQETLGKRFEYIPCLFEPPYMELMEFSEFKKIMRRSKKKDLLK